MGTDFKDFFVTKYRDIQFKNEIKMTELRTIDYKSAFDQSPRLDYPGKLSRWSPLPWATMHAIRSWWSAIYREYAEFSHRYIDDVWWQYGGFYDFKNMMF